MDCLVPSGKMSPLPSPCRQNPPEALRAASEKALCFLPELGQPEPPDHGVASHMHRHHLLQCDAACPCGPHRPLLSPLCCLLQPRSKQSRQARHVKNLMQN